MRWPSTTRKIRLQGILSGVMYPSGRTLQYILARAGFGAVHYAFTNECRTVVLFSRHGHRCQPDNHILLPQPVANPRLNSGCSLVTSALSLLVEDNGIPYQSVDTLRSTYTEQGIELYPVTGEFLPYSQTVETQERRLSSLTWN